MLSARGARNVCSRCGPTFRGVLGQHHVLAAQLPRLERWDRHQPNATRRIVTPSRTFSTTPLRAKDGPPEKNIVGDKEAAASVQEGENRIPKAAEEEESPAEDQAVDENRLDVIVEDGSASETGLASKEGEDALQGPEAVERVVREAKQRFRDTLPPGYLNEEEYKLYERLYGAPLRKTEPEDVGIPTHSDMISDAPAEAEVSEFSGTVVDGNEHVKYAEGGSAVQEDRYQSEQDEQSEEPYQGEQLGEEAPIDERIYAQENFDYIEAVARNQREYNALKMLEKDFLVAAQNAKETQAEDEADQIKAAEDETLAQLDAVAEEYREEVEEEGDGGEDPYGPDGIPARSRAHPYSNAARSGTNPTTVHLPRRGLVDPIASLLSRTDVTHLREAAEVAYGGPGLPNSAITPQGLKNRPMVGIPLQAGQHRMSDINADVFLSVFYPQMYATALGIFTEVRKRLGTEWMRNLISRGNGEGPRVLDVGSGGAGLAAWQSVLDAEWAVMKEQGKTGSPVPPGKKATVIGSDRLRNRVNMLLSDTTFLPRLPDYLHSVEGAERLLDAPQVPLPRKTYDIIIASHLLMQVPEGHRRKAILNSLWSLLSTEGGILIVLEKGHPRGFEAVANIRSKLLNEYLLHRDSEPEIDPEGGEFRRVKEPGMIIAPCTTHSKCPLYLVEGTSKGRKDICSFSQRFARPSFHNRIMRGGDRDHDDVEFSYLAVRRGVALDSGITQGREAADKAFVGYEDSAEAPHPLSLPRNIARPIKRRGHIILDVCTPAGRFERWIVPKSRGRQAYRDARKSRWGDLWALGAKTRTDRNVRLGKPDGGKLRVVNVDLGGPGGGIAVRESGKKGDAAGKRKGRKTRKTEKTLLEELEAEEQRTSRERKKTAREGKLKEENV